MSVLDEEDESLAHFLESEVLSEVSDQEDAKTEEEPKAKRVCVNENENKEEGGSSSNNNNNNNSRSRSVLKRIETGLFSKIPPELFPHILKFLSSEDLVACSLVCRFLNNAASDEFLWRRLGEREIRTRNLRFIRYCMRWGLLAPTNKLRECPWKKLYIQRDEEDMVELVRNCPTEFKEYYIQMQAAKRSQVPLPSQVNDDRIILDKTVADQVSLWKSSKGLTDKSVMIHAEKLLWIPSMSFWSVRYLGIVLIGYFHRPKWSQMLNSNKVV
ncbi:F-box protein SKIP31 isoform X3 [Corylus avellana]|uniref:F-box protein SKIP31 isoform X3 n=1 Tax=Corylus avellana TaxID=13451 RepID=UPI00286D1D5B|nr:F-box protein SKIP31 isoform X3 [Corylus avellana]